MQRTQRPKALEQEEVNASRESLLGAAEHIRYRDPQPDAPVGSDADAILSVGDLYQWLAILSNDDSVEQCDGLGRDSLAFRHSGSLLYRGS